MAPNLRSKDGKMKGLKDRSIYIYGIYVHLIYIYIPRTHLVSRIVVGRKDGMPRMHMRWENKRFQVSSNRCAKWFRYRVSVHHPFRGLIGTPFEGFGIDR